MGPPIVYFPKREAWPTTYQENYVYRPRPHTPKTHFSKTPMFYGQIDEFEPQKQFPLTPPAPKGWQYSEVPPGGVSAGHQVQDHTIAYQPVFEPPPRRMLCNREGPNPTELPQKFTTFESTVPVYFRNDAIDAIYKEALETNYDPRDVCRPRPRDCPVIVQQTAARPGDGGIRWEENKPNPYLPNIYTQKSIYTEGNDPNDPFVEKVRRLAREGRLGSAYVRPIPNYAGHRPGQPLEACTKARKPLPHMVSLQHTVHCKYPAEEYRPPKFYAYKPFSKMIQRNPPHNPFNKIVDNISSAIRI